MLSSRTVLRVIVERKEKKSQGYIKGKVKTVLMDSMKTPGGGMEV